MQTLTGFVGLGHMGGAMARRLLAAGHALVVHDLDPRAVERMTALGARAAASPRAVADQASVVFLCLPSVEAAREVATGADGLAGGGALRVVVETSTVGPASVRELAAAMAQWTVEVVDAPVSGGPRGAEAGTLSLMHAGSPEAIACALPLLEAIAGRRFDVGAEPGLAQVCKLVNNAISAAGMVAACEATVLGVRAGLDADTLLAAINAGSGRNAATLDKFPNAILNGRFDYGGPMGLMLKDLQLFIDEARDRGVPGVMAPAALLAWQEAVRRTGFDADYSMLIRHLEADAGVEVRSRRAGATT
jgi:3-hydroxyisobutyrate dehydrogenase-like beta-hydroxyacid dehydrogenase